MVSPGSAGAVLVWCILAGKGAVVTLQSSPKSTAQGTWADSLTRSVSWQIVTQLAVGKEALLAREVDALLACLAPQGEVRALRLCGGTSFHGGLAGACL